MGKPFGEGLKYMRLDTDVHDNDKIDILRDEFDDAGFAFWTLLHCRVFKYSYYMDADERSVAHFCKKILRKPVEDFYKMLEFAIKIKVFDRESYDKHKIITSKGIQRNYLDITKKWSKVKIIQEYIIEDVNIQPYQLCLYSPTGNYKGYKKKNSEELLKEEFIPRKHEKKLAEEESRAEKQAKAADEYGEQQKQSQFESEAPKPVVLPSKPVNGSHTANINAKQTLTFYSESQLAKDVLSFWDLNMIKSSPMHMLVSHCLYSLDGQSLLDEFTDQFYAYKQYKLLNGGVRYRHKLPNFIGNQDNLFQDGQWQAENWVSKLKEHEQTNKKVNGKEARRGYTPENGYGEI